LAVKTIAQFQQNGKPGAKVKIRIGAGCFLAREQAGRWLANDVGQDCSSIRWGRVVSLFAHKKYDTLSLRYVDADGGIHGAIFQLAKRQGELVKNELIAQGVTISFRQGQATKESATEAKHENK